MFINFVKGNWVMSSLLGKAFHTDQIRVCIIATDPLLIILYFLWCNLLMGCNILGISNTWAWTGFVCVDLVMISYPFCTYILSFTY